MIYNIAIPLMGGEESIVLLRQRNELLDSTIDKQIMPPRDDIAAMVSWVKSRLRSESSF